MTYATLNCVWEMRETLAESISIGKNRLFHIFILIFIFLLLYLTDYLIAVWIFFHFSFLIITLIFIILCHFCYQFHYFVILIFSILLFSNESRVLPKYFFSHFFFRLINFLLTFSLKQNRSSSARFLRFHASCRLLSF